MNDLLPKSDDFWRNVLSSDGRTIQLFPKWKHFVHQPKQSKIPQKFAGQHAKFSGKKMVWGFIGKSVKNASLKKASIRVHRSAKFAQSTILCFQYLGFHDHTFNRAKLAKLQYFFTHNWDQNVTKSFFILIY